MPDLYIQSFSGVSGDMILAAFLDAGLPLDALVNTLNNVLDHDEFSISFENFLSKGISGKRLKISENHSKDRDFRYIKNSISNSQLNDKIKILSLSTFNLLAEAEGIVHNIDKDDVHFHEIGGVDTIIDIVGAAFAVDYFCINNIYVSDIVVGTGEIMSCHGVMPNPAPATTILLKDYNLKFLNENFEFTTPTGAAILKGFAAKSTLENSFKIDKIGYGFGSKTLHSRANFLRLFISGEKPSNISENIINSEILEIEFNIDDMTGEEIGFFIEESKKFDVVDIQCIPSITKKNRPGYIFKILVESLEADILKFIFNFTTTLLVSE